MNANGPTSFVTGLPTTQQAALFNLAAQAVQLAPAKLVPWRCGTQRLGLLSPERASWLAQQLPGCSRVPTGLLWDAQAMTTQQRSEVLQTTLLAAREQGLLPGWREERFSFWHSGCTTPEPERPALFHAERSGFRWLGLQSHAVHVNGFLPDGRLWCARRALTKATDPGLLDNITAGGLPMGETVQDCLLRELAEEAGLFSLQDHTVQAAGTVRTSRLEREGWHDEIIHVFNLTLAIGFAPVNQDGEVAEFMCLQPSDVLALALAGAFTVDAVQSLLQGLRAGQAAGPVASA